MGGEAKQGSLYAFFKKKDGGSGQDKAAAPKKASNADKKAHSAAASKGGTAPTAPGALQRSADIAGAVKDQDINDQRSKVRSWGPARGPAWWNHHGGVA